MDAVPGRTGCLVRCTYPGETQTIRLFLTVGQRACDVAEITEIRQETVVIKNLLTNRLELLTFPRAGAVAVPSDTTVVRTEPTPRVPVPADVPSSNLVTIEVRKETMDGYLANLPELMTSAVVTPHFRNAGNGQSIIEGFEINRIRDASAAQQLGLKNGDVVLEVNGDKLDSAASVFRLMGQVQVFGQATLIVLRNGQRMTLVVNMK